MNLRKFLLDLFFPIFCVGCGSEGKFLCDKCYEKIGIRNDFFDFRHESGVLSNSPLDALLAACEYKGNSSLNKAIHAFKYDFVKDLAKPLSRLLIATVNNMEIGRIIKDFVVVPVPLHKKRYNWRGFNQAELLAKNLCDTCKMKIADPLERITFSTPQMELKKEDRLKNVEDAFIVRTQNVPEKILLVDDVATTTATLTACASSLKKAGTRTVFGLVLARVR